MTNHYNITRECCHYVADRLEDISVQLITVVELFAHDVDIPLVYIDASVLRHPSVSSTIRAGLLELHHLVEGCHAKRDDAASHLIKLKDALRRNSNIPGVRAMIDDSPLEIREVLLCDSVAKMLFNLNMVVERYDGLVTAIRSTLLDLKYKDVSLVCSALKGDIHVALKETALTPRRIDCANMPKESALHALLRHLQRNQIVQAVLLLRGVSSCAYIV